MLFLMTILTSSAVHSDYFIIKKHDGAYVEKLLSTLLQRVMYYWSEKLIIMLYGILHVQIT